MGPARHARRAELELVPPRSRWRCRAVQLLRPPGPAEARPVARNARQSMITDLGAVSRFAPSLARVSWFAAVAKPFTDGETRAAREYLSALGFADAILHPVPDWHSAEA